MSAKEIDNDNVTIHTAQIHTNKSIKNVNQQQQA